MDILLVNTLSSNLLAALLLIVPLWRVFSRAGLNPALSLLVFIPVAGLMAVLLVLALARWPTTEGAR